MRALLDASKKMAWLLNEIRTRELTSWSNKAMDLLLEVRPVIAQAENNLKVADAAQDLLAVTKMMLDLEMNHLVDFKKYGLKNDDDIKEKLVAAIAKAEGK